MRQIVGILGTPIDVLNTNQVLARIEQFIQERRFHLIATANTDFLINAIADPELSHILRQADLVVPDGMPLVWASRLMGTPLPERVTGADIVPQLARLSAQKGYRLYLVGALPEVLQQARERLEKDYPGVQIVGSVSPPATSVFEMDSEALLTDIVHAQPDILLVAFGNPKQEKWIHLHRERLRNVPVCMGVGGSFDFLAGHVSRAPLFVQRMGLEWVHRLLQNPQRLWRRYSRDLFQGVRQLGKQWRALRQQRISGHSGLDVAYTEDFAILSVIGDFNQALLPRFRAVAENALDSGQQLILDFSGVSSLDTEALGTLINLPKCAAYRAKEMHLVALPAQISNVLHHAHVHIESPTPTMAHAFTTRRHDGLIWDVKSNSELAVVRVKGSSDYATLNTLERTCVQLLEEGKRLDLDVRGVTYVDTYMLKVLYRLKCSENSGQQGRGVKERFRLVTGSVLWNALQREKITRDFIIREKPELVLDSVDTTEAVVAMRHRALP